MKYATISFGDLADKQADQNFIRLSTPVFSFLLGTPIALIGVLLLWILYWKTYLLPSAALIAILGFRVWKIFDSINNLEIDRLQKIFTLSSRNLIKSVFIGDKQFRFGDVKRFVITESDNWQSIERRYFISVILQDSKTIVVTHTFDEESALRIQRSLQHIVR